MAPATSTPQRGRTAPTLTGPGRDMRAVCASRPWTVTVWTGRTGAIVFSKRFARETTATGYHDGFAAAARGLKRDRPQRTTDKSFEYLIGYKMGHLEGCADAIRYGKGK